ncbi:hypothetical protein [Microseira wollei]|nr:hypothetical protein [Microseira wollei]
MTRQQLAQQLPPGSALNPQLLSSSDITAISESDAQITDQIFFNAGGVNPAQGLVELPQNVVDPASLIATNPCLQGATSQFVITGRGGLPANPTEPLRDDVVRVSWSELPPQQESRGAGEQGSRGELTDSLMTQIVPAQGWVINYKGVVTLVGYNPGNPASSRNSNPQTICPLR